MELRHLRYFVAVVEEQSFTKAAEKLFIAQPPLSRQIQNLEQELDIQLFERGSRPLKTTESGQFFYQHAVKLLSNAEEIKSMTKRIGIADRTISIGFVGSLLFGLLSRILFLFKQQHPYLKIEMMEMNTYEQIQALKEGRIDVGFGRLRISDPAIKRVLLREERLVVAAHSSHPLAQREGLHLSELVDQQLFLYPNTGKANFATQVRGIFSEYGLEPKNIRIVRELQLALGFVAAGEGICIAPESAQNIKLAHLNFIPLADAFTVSPVFMAMRNMDESEYIRYLFDAVYQVYDLEALKYDRAVF